MIEKHKILQKPVLGSLTESHNVYSFSEKGLIAYNPKYLRLAHLDAELDTTSFMIEYGKNLDYFYVVCEGEPILPSNIEIDALFRCYQMVMNDLVGIKYDEDLILLDDSYKAEAYELIWKVMPGFYEMDTLDLGSYYGIFKEEKLVAVTGVRMESHDYQELSAVVTDHAFRRKGYARQLSHRVSQAILERGKIPFLHVLDSNVRAIKMYENLGYEIIRKMNFYKVQHKK